jgi:pilus assembly protein TadC
MSRARAWAGGIAGGLIAWVVIGGYAGLVAAACTTFAASRWLLRLETSASRAHRDQARADLPFAADLLAAALRSGAPTERGARVVGTALAGSIGRQLVSVADGLRLGLDPKDAWSAMRAVPEAARLADAVVGSADSGAAVAGALERLADGLRVAAAARVESSAQRLGVLMVLPLGLCFLPAFVFAGIAPVIVAVLGGVLR